MAIKRYENAVRIKLRDFIPADHFRLISFYQRKVPKGISEIPVNIEVSKAFAQKLPFKISGSGRLYGYVRPSGLLSELNRFGGKKNAIGMISLSDWENEFLMIAECADEPTEFAYTVDPDELLELLDNCLKPDFSEYE